ncbi:TadE/TadG family type IV pilus assembly protein [Sphingomonas crocodyli]|uniref:Pilus assembly protein n=1 Tax=Sphingomonas crocodyli TaxID=1979270 RepID=A0A437M9Z0_9SPHN|nr:TadE/TadG family type IV pilus assembly protein [Sphingomonas crocodyli]RVT94444.1 pilus assembly protein [Sphingomonas crocodyli]
MIALLARLRRDQRGVATIEFGLISVLFFAVISGALDIGIWYQHRLRLDSAVEQGGVAAFNQRSAVDANAIGTFVAAASQLSTAPTVTVTCNGATCVNSGRTSKCLGGTSGDPTFTNPVASLCLDGSLPGYYMVIKAVASSSSVVVPIARFGGSMTQTSRAIVRLQ